MTSLDRRLDDQSDAAPVALFTNGTDTVAARDVDDAWSVWEEQYGEKRSDYEDEWEWERLPDEQVINVWCDADGDISEPGDNGADVVAKTAAEWAAKLGRGFAWSTEF